MSENTKPELIEMSWQDALPSIKAVNPELAHAIEELNPGKDYTLVKVNYPWGANILNEGELNLPNKAGEIVPITDGSIANNMQQKIGYNGTMPLGLVLKNSIELYLKANDRIIPFALMPEGRLFALWVSFQNNITTNQTGRVSSISAGARTIFFLPKISDNFMYKRLKQTIYLNEALPQKHSQQWNLLRELAVHPDFTQPWQAEVLYFTSKWVEEHKEVSWRLFREYLLSLCWHSTSHLRDQVVFDLVFSTAMAAKNLKPNPYLSDTVKHLYTLGQSVYPGLKIVNDDKAAPARGFQDVFNDLYGLKYAPTMLQSAHLMDEPNESIYYSLSSPTLMTFSPKSRKAENKLEDLREIKHVIDQTLAYILEDQFNLGESPLLTLAKRTQFDYYHTDIDKHQELSLPSDMIVQDLSLQEHLSRYPDKPFCDTSLFLRGCVRLSKK